MPEATYEALSTLQNYLCNAISGGLHVYQSHSLGSPTEQGEPSPTGFLIPAPAKPIPPGLPTPKVGAVGAFTEQGGGGQDVPPVPPPESGPLRSSFLFSPQENVPKQRSDVPADQGATTNVGFVPVTGQNVGGLNTTAVMERDAEIVELRRQVQALQAQNNAQTVVQTSAQDNVFGQTRPGVIPSRDQSGLLSKAGLQSKAPPKGCQKDFRKHQG